MRKKTKPSKMRTKSTAMDCRKDRTHFWDWDVGKEIS